jgi:hypothetical protein
VVRCDPSRGVATLSCGPMHRSCRAPAPVGIGFPLGVNVIATWRREMLVGNIAVESLGSIPVGPTGRRSRPVVKTATALVGVDGIALDAHGGGLLSQRRPEPPDPRDSSSRHGRPPRPRTSRTSPAHSSPGLRPGDQKTLYVLNFSLFPPEPTPGVSASGSACRDTRALIDGTALICR